MQIGDLMKKHFLVVDDSELNLRVVQTLLEKYGFGADYVTSAEHAYAALESSEYDLVLMDYLMPETNGIEATVHIRAMNEGHTREYYKKLPIIALTAEDNAALLNSMIKSGINDVLIKPLIPSAFKAMLDKWAPTVHGIDENTLIGMLDADRTSYFELISIFCQDIPGKHERIKAALSQDDYQSYVVEVHKIKGEAKVIGATALAEASKLLEFTGKAITGVVPNGKSDDDNKKIIKRDTPKVLKALESIGRELKALMDDYSDSHPAEDDKELDKKVTRELRPELEKLSRYCGHALESLLQADYNLTREWIEEIQTTVKGLISE